MGKIFKIAVFIVVIGLIGSCKKIRKLKEFDLEYTEDFTIPGSSTLLNLPFDIATPDKTTNTGAEYANEGTNSKLVEEVTLSRLLFTVKSPSSGNFDFLNSVEIYLASPNNTEILVASKYNIPETGLQQLDMDVASTNLKEFLQDVSYSLRVKTVTDKNVSYDMVIKTDETFHVKARLKNVFRRK